MSLATLEQPRIAPEPVMALDPADPMLLPLRDIARTLPRRTAGPIALDTVYRWVRKGVKTRSGQRRYLPTLRIGATHYSTRAAVLAWIQALSESRPSVNPPAQ